MKEQDEEKLTVEIEDKNVVVGIGLDNVGVSSSEVSTDGKPFPELLGLQLDLWEGTQWDVLGSLSSISCVEVSSHATQAATIVAMQLQWSKEAAHATRDK
ncbi:hypothetical protein Gohar_006786 [Gossypium harknessii]|uniref:Uncharacterized protein n=1 Tax=Gossypium harknessii TaxID=34285 RepID=A0A7J9GEI5_9ROSI|nr:hypothetical protein [Gossypium harknessii]